MTHAIDIWRLVAVVDELVSHAEPAPGDELPSPEQGDEAVIEISRQYPGLSRALAEYLAR